MPDNTMDRRHFLASCVGITVLSGCTVYRTESGNIQIGNATGQEVWKEITIRTEEGIISGPETVYHTRTRTRPTEGYRVTLTDVAPPGTYEVQVAFDSIESEEESGTHTTQWAPSGNPGEALIINLTSEFDIEFFTQSGRW